MVSERDKERGHQYRRMTLQGYRNKPCWRFCYFVLPFELHDVRFKLKYSGFNYRTEKKYKGGKLVGYNVYIY